MITSIDYRSVVAEVGSYVEPDGWTVGQCLVEGDDFSHLRIPSRHGSLAVEVELAGKRIHQRNGADFVRVRITFLGDGEAGTVTNGWMRV